jgi:CubicO group peptidase (beta-lactamase class C family)
VFARAYGFANTGTRRRNRLDTRFNLASAGKMFTGVAVAQLVERGKLRFTDRVGRYVPELRRAVGSTVTVAQLLDHTSGLGDYFRDPGYQALKPQLTSLERYLPLIAGERLLFRPGARFSYSNSGFIVLGLIVERVSGLSYYDYVQRHVFARAGMTRTACLRRGQGGETVAIGYTRANPAVPAPRIRACFRRSERRPAGATRPSATCIASRRRSSATGSSAPH